MKKITVSAHLAVSIAGLIFSSATLAQSTWDWRGDPPNGCDPSTCTVGTGINAVTATVSGYGAESSSSFFLKGGNSNGAKNGVNDVDMSGLGVMSKDASTNSSGVRNDENKNSPNHSIDNFKRNQDGSTNTDSSTGGAAYAEVLAIEFSKAVSLTQVAVAWTYTDSDAMIFRWDGAGAADLANYKPDQLTATNGWTLVSAGQFSTSSNKLSFADSLYSSYWLVSTALGQANTTSGADKYNTNNDGFKVSTFTGNFCAYAPTNGQCKPPGGGGPDEVPEPGSLALAAAGLLGLTMSRRRFKRS